MEIADLGDKEFRRPFDLMYAHCLRLNARIFNLEFDGSRQLDPTLNKGEVFIAEATERILLYEQGSFPLFLAAPSVRETLRLVRREKRKYGARVVKTLDQALHSYFHLWFYEGAPRLPIGEYRAAMLRCQAKLIAAMCNFNVAVLDLEMKAMSPSKAAERLTKIEPPQLEDVQSCREFCRRLYGAIREHEKTRVHSATQAVEYILHGAAAGDLYYEDCLVARKIQKDRNWTRPTFTTYCKQQPAAKPKNLRRAAKQRATQKLVRRDLGRL